MISLDPNVCRNARLSRDPRFDGQFYTAVSSTGIYCRPVCPVRSPKESNVRYYRTAAEAAQSGYRPCLRCRPESAPASPAWQGTSTTVNRALQLIQAGALNQQSMENFSARLGVGERYLRKLFDKQLGVSPAVVASTQRLHFARKLIVETTMSMSDIAFASGYGSLRRFNSAIRGAFSCNPTQLRRQNTAGADTGRQMVLELNYRPPLDWTGLLDFFSRHSVEGLEGVEHESYWRNIETEDEMCRIHVSHHPKKAMLLLSLEHNGHQNLMTLVAMVRQMFDLDASPMDIGEVLGRSKLIAPLWKNCQGVRSPVHASTFESCVRGIVGQQVSVAAARKVVSRLVNSCAESERGLLVFPSAQQLLSLPDSALPMPNSRKQTLRNVCQYLVGLEHEDRFDQADFLSLKGIGPWTAAMVNMRGLGDPDSYPNKDLGLLQAAESRGVHGDKALNHELQVCQPWRSYAANLLWRNPP